MACMLNNEWTMDHTNMLSYQHCIISLYKAFEQPGGGGSLCPFIIYFKYYGNDYFLIRACS